MDRLWTAYMPSISPGEEAERAAALKSAWGDFGATERRLEGLEQAGDHTGAAGLITGDFTALAGNFRRPTKPAPGRQAPRRPGSPPTPAAPSRGDIYWIF